MHSKKILIPLPVVVLIFSCQHQNISNSTVWDQQDDQEIMVSIAKDDSLQCPEEIHISNLQQLTFGGNNAETYWSKIPLTKILMLSPDGKHLVFSSNRNNNGTRDTNLFVADWIE